MTDRPAAHAGAPAAAPAAKRRRGRLVAGIAVAAVLVALGAGYLISRQAGVPTIQTATVAASDLEVTVSAPGSVAAGTVTPVYAPAPGRLSAVKVADGQAVKAGDVLATLDDAALKQAVAQAQAQVAQADAQAESARAAGAAADAQRAAAKAMPDDTDAQAAARRAAIAAADAAAGSAKAALDAAGATRSSAASALAAAQADAKKATITAPVAGTVRLPVLAITSLDGTGPTAAAGASVTTAAPLFTITDPSKVVFEAQVDEADVAGVKAGQQASVTLDAYPGRTFAGSVAEVAASSIATKTGGVAYLVKVPLTPGDATLRLGMSGDAALATASVPQALVVPVQAVFADAGKRYVYKVADGKVAKTEVAVGASTDTQAQIVSGLAAGDVVATTQLTALTDGVGVHVA